MSIRIVNQGLAEIFDDAKEKLRHGYSKKAVIGLRILYDNDKLDWRHRKAKLQLTSI